MGAQESTLRKPQPPQQQQQHPHPHHQEAASPAIMDVNTRADQAPMGGMAPMMGKKGGAMGTGTGMGTGMDMGCCIDNCINCERACLEAIPHCLSKGHKGADPQMVMMLQNCAEMCSVAARFMISGSAVHVHTCCACKEVCNACAMECENMGHDECMARCAKACRTCAGTCGSMSKA